MKSHSRKKLKMIIYKLRTNTKLSDEETGIVDEIVSDAHQEAGYL